MTNEKTAKKVANLLLSIQAVTFRFNPPFTYTTGLKSPVYLDNRIVMSYPDVRNQIINFYIEAIKENIGLPNAEWISATATAAIPHGTLVADRLHLPLVYVRPTTKSYGKGNKIEGYLKKGSKVVIIEDHITTADSVVNNIKTIRESGSEATYCITTSTYETQKSQDSLKENNITLLPLTTGKIIIQTALENGQITQKEKDSIDVWFEDPPAWAKKMGFE
jgi:orotate phosphoribosyltransferase